MEDRDKEINALLARIVESEDRGRQPIHNGMLAVIAVLTGAAFAVWTIFNAGQFHPVDLMFAFWVCCPYFFIAMTTRWVSWLAPSMILACTLAVTASSGVIAFRDETVILFLVPACQLVAALVFTSVAMLVEALVIEHAIATKLMRADKPTHQFRIRELAALTAGIAFACSILVLADRRSVPLVVAWAIGSTLGIVVTFRSASVLLGALIGGALCPMLLFAVYAAAGSGPATFHRFWVELIVVLGLATCASAIQAALMGIIAEGFRITRKNRFKVESTDTKTAEASSIRALRDISRRSKSLFKECS